MLKVLNFNRTQTGVIGDYTGLEIVHSLEDGDEQISFTYLGAVTIKNEYYVQTDRARYTIKECDPEDGKATYHGLLDLEDLQRTPFKQFTSIGQTLEAAAEAILENTGWTVNSTVTGTRNVQRFKKTPLELLYAIRDAWMCEIRFDNLHNVVYFTEKFGSDKGVYMMRGLNLKKISPSIDTFDYVTRIIPYGADGLTIEEVNDGIPYVENYQYSTKILTLIWEDTSYTDASALKTDAIKKLDDISQPKVAYSCDILNLAKMSSVYSLFDYKLGDTIRLNDPLVNVSVKQRIVKYYEHPDNPEDDKVEISNTVLTFEELQARMKAAADAWEDISNADGTVNGVYVHGIEADNVVGIETVITNNATVQAGVTNVSVQYAQGDSPTVAPDTGWSPVAPEWDSGKYMWQRTFVTKASGQTTMTAETCISGAAGASVIAQLMFYALSTSNTEAPPMNGYILTEGGGHVMTEDDGYIMLERNWSQEMPEKGESEYIWMFIRTVFTGGETIDSDPVCLTGDKGTDGHDGSGITSVVEYYAKSSSTTPPADSDFDTTIVTIDETDKYLWNYEVISYTNGNTTTTAKRIIGVYGATGAPGTSITGVINHYLATSASSGVTKDTAGWSDTIQTMTGSLKYLWNYETVSYSDGNTSETTPCIIGVYGDKGDKGDTGDTGPQGPSGTSAYVWIRYSNDGGSTFTPNAGLTPGKYIGVYSGDSSTAPSTTASYVWAQILGDDGRGVESYTIYYAVTPTKTAPEFYTGSRAIGTEAGGTILTEAGGRIMCEQAWFTTPPTKPVGWYLWMVVLVTYTEGSPFTSSPMLISGTDALKITSVRTQYYLSTSSSAPAGGEWYFSPPQYILGRYYWTREVTTFEDGSTSVTDPILDWAITDANSASVSALESANGKNANFYQTDAPSTTGRKVGDLWFKIGTTNTSDPSYVADDAGKIIALYKWDGNQWTTQEMTSAVFAYLDAGKLTVGKITAVDIEGVNIEGVDISGSSVRGGTISGTEITGSTYETTEIATAYQMAFAQNDGEFYSTYRKMGLESTGLRADTYSRNYETVINSLRLLPAVHVDEWGDETYGLLLAPGIGSSNQFIAAYRLYAADIWMADKTHNRMHDIRELFVNSVSEASVDSSGATTSTGSVMQNEVRVEYLVVDGTYRCPRVKGRVMLQNVSARPTITFTFGNAAKSLPTFNQTVGCAYTHNGSNIVMCDGGYLSHTSGSNQITFTSYNTMGSVPAGYYVLYFTA